MQQDTLYQKIAHHVSNFYSEHANEKLKYHTVHHTESVVRRAAEIAAHYKLADHDRLVLHTAAWFHDTGHLTGDIPDHEQRSAQLMRDYLTKEMNDENFISEVSRAILATRFPTSPSNLVEQILCDADTYHLGTPEFEETNKQVRKELKLRGHEDMTKGWTQKSVLLLEQHRFYTDYCQGRLAEGKNANLRIWRQKLTEKETVKEEKLIEKANEKDPGFDKDLSKQEKKKKDGLVARGIQTMLRLTSENHLRLSEMADGKANILISVNSIIIGVILSVLLRRLEIDTYLTIPTMIFLASSVSTIIIAILATLPKVTEGRFNREDIVNRKVNLLFFGNFYRSSLSEYEWAMERLMEDRDYLYGSLVKDIYQLGVVLGKKYRLVRLAYNVFMIGIIASVIAFTVAVLLNNQHPAPEITTGTNSPL